ncbi:MAG: hypothetical protein IKN24_04340 [Lachnospiraceae bacterium]|nr:hypothetical protein [Lachnospiraceae bacterium]
MRRKTIGGRLLNAYMVHGLFALAVVLFAFMAMNSPVISVGEKRYSLLGALTENGVMIKCRQEMINNSYLTVYGFDAMKWFAILLPVVCALPALYIYESIDDNTRNFLLIRMSKTRYCLLQFMAAFVTGFSVVVCGVMLYALVAYALLPGFGESPLAGGLAEYYGRTPWERFLFLARKVSDTAVAGGFMACFTLILYHVVHDRFLTITTPMMLMYISDKLYVLHDKKRFENYDIMTGPEPDRICFLFPSNIGNMHYMLQTECGVSYGWYFAGMAGLLLLAFIIYRKIYDRVMG